MLDRKNENLFFIDDENYIYIEDYPRDGYPITHMTLATIIDLITTDLKHLTMAMVRYTQLFIYSFFIEQDEHLTKPELMKIDFPMLDGRMDKAKSYSNIYRKVSIKIRDDERRENYLRRYWKSSAHNAITAHPFVLHEVPKVFHRLVQTHPGGVLRLPSSSPLDPNIVILRPKAEGSTS